MVMGKVYDYTWKHEVSILSKHGLHFTQPLTAGVVFVDLLDGKAYRVHSVYKAEEFDRSGPSMPEDVVQTFYVGSIPENQLVALRKKRKFEVSEGLGPREE